MVVLNVLSLPLDLNLQVWVCSVKVPETRKQSSVPNFHTHTHTLSLSLSVRLSVTLTFTLSFSLLFQHLTLSLSLSHVRYTSNSGLESALGSLAVLCLGQFPIRECVALEYAQEPAWRRVAGEAQLVLRFPCLVGPAERASLQSAARGAFVVPRSESHSCSLLLALSLSPFSLSVEIVYYQKHARRWFRQSFAKGTFFVSWPMATISGIDVRAAPRTHARGGVSEGAPFGFLSHGVGGQFMALLAYRLKQAFTRYTHAQNMNVRVYTSI